MMVEALMPDPGPACKSGRAAELSNPRRRCRIGRRCGLQLYSAGELRQGDEVFIIYGNMQNLV
jgi:hypothetical protein